MTTSFLSIFANFVFINTVKSIDDSFNFTPFDSDWTHHLGDFSLCTQISLYERRLSHTIPMTKQQYNEAATMRTKTILFNWHRLYFAHSYTCEWMCVCVFECEWIRAVVTGSQFLSIVLPCVDFLRSPFSIRFAKHSVEILSSIRLKVLLGISQIRTIKNSNQAFSHWI